MAELSGNDITQEYLNNIPATEAVAAPSFQLFVSNGKGTPILIGAIQSFNKASTRNMTRRLSLSSTIPGQTVEIIPGALQSLSLTIKRAMLNSSTMMNALGFGQMEDLIRANTPLTIKEVRYIRAIPTAGTALTASTGTTYTVTYNSCYVKTMPMDVSVEGDWLVIQNCEIEVGYLSNGVAGTWGLSPDEAAGAK